MANIIVGANIQMNGTGQAVHQMQNLAHGINVEFNRVSQSIHNVNNTFNRFENNITRINNQTTQTFSNITQVVNNFRNNIQAAFSNMMMFNGARVIGSALRNIIDTIQQTERAIGSLQAITGSIDEATVKFQELNDVSRKIPQSFDEITQAALTLGKNGLDTTAGSIEALAKIARGTGVSMSSVANALTNASMGQLKSLKQLGIQATKEGDKIRLTFKGVTTEIENDTGKLQSYLNNLANTQFKDTLKPEMEGITGATKRVNEAWGDMWRQLGDSGVTKGAIAAIDGITTALDTLTKFLKSKTISDAINGIGDIFDGMVQGVKGLFTQMSDAFLEALNQMDTSSENSYKAQITTFGNWLSFVGLVIREFIGYVQMAVGAWQSFTSAIGSTMAEITHGTTKEILAASATKSKLLRISKENGDFDKAKKEMEEQRRGKVSDEDVYKWLKGGYGSFGSYKEKYQQIREEQLNSIKDTDKTFADKLTDGIEESNNRITKQLNEYRDKVAKGISGNKIKTIGDLTGSTPNAPTDLNSGRKTDGEKDGDKGHKSGAPKAITDTWTSYYQRFLDNQAKTLSKSEQIEYEYHKKLAELDKYYHENRNVSEQEYNNVKLAIEKQYQDAKKELNKSAYDFIQSLQNDEMIKIQDQYAQKLAKLEEFHNQQLISEEEYLSNLKTIQDEYYAKDSEYQTKKRRAKTDEMLKPYQQTAKVLGEVANGFSELTSSLDENSSAYKAAFALQKGFAVASATAQACVAWMNALSTQPFYPAGMAAYAQAIGMTTQILAQLSSITMHDKGGQIPAGALGIVGEYGPELIRGPASVTSRKDTEDLLSHNNSNVTVNLIEDSSRAGQVNQRNSETDKQMIIDVIVSNIRGGGDVANAMSGTYGLARQGY